MIYSNLSVSGSSGDLSESRKKNGYLKKINFWLFPKAQCIKVRYRYCTNNTQSLSQRRGLCLTLTLSSIVACCQLFAGIN